MRALMLDPPVLLLDEPMAALDPLVRADLRADLKAIFRDLRKTVVLVTHDLRRGGRTSGIGSSCCGTARSCRRGRWPSWSRTRPTRS